MHTVPINVSCFFDYICPFCYIGDARLQQIGKQYPLHIHWRFLEIHPDNPPEGRPLRELGYPPEQWAQMLANIERMAKEDKLPLAPRTFTTNSRRALLLAQTVLDERPTHFPALHAAIFRAYFLNGRNIGDPAILTALAEQHAVADLLPLAWDDPQPLRKLLGHVEAAQALGLSGVPALQIGGRVFGGAASMETLEQALLQARNEPS